MNRKKSLLILSLGASALLLGSCDLYEMYPNLSSRQSSIDSSLGSTSTPSSESNTAISSIEPSSDTLVSDESKESASSNISLFSSEASLSSSETISFSEVSVSSASSATSASSSQSKPQNVVLDFYTCNDVHGNVVDSNLGAGIAKTATLLKQKSQGKNPVYIASGDMWQGSVESNLTHGALMTQWMKYMGFPGLTLGNHEYDWGKEWIAKNATDYDFPMLGINILDKDTQQRASYVQPSVVIESGGAKIGIIGAIGDCYTSISYSKVMDVEFVLDRSSNLRLTNLIQAESTRLREEEDCDFIVLSIHGDTSSGDTYYNEDLSTNGYVDVVLEGHTHSSVHYVDSGNVHHFQSSANSNIEYTHFSVNLDTDTDEYTITFNENSDRYDLTSNEATSLEDDEGSLDIINQYDFSQYNQTIGTNAYNRSGSSMKQLCADLYLDKGVEKWTTYAEQIVLGGGYISIRGDKYLAQGDITYAQLYSLFPFDNDVVLMQLRGSLLKSNFINTRNSNYFMKYSSYGANLRDNQDLIANTDYYYVITDTYTYDYLVSRDEDVVFADAYDSGGYYARDFLAEYASAGGFAS